jgi:hypothetical protein
MMPSYSQRDLHEYYQRKQKEARANEIEAIKRKYSDAPYIWATKTADIIRLFRIYRAEVVYLNAGTLLDKTVPIAFHASFTGTLPENWIVELAGELEKLFGRCVTVSPIDINNKPGNLNSMLRLPISTQ